MKFAWLLCERSERGVHDASAWRKPCESGNDQANAGGEAASRPRPPAEDKAMLDKILFWVVLVWMVALLVMAIWAVREVIKEDGRTPTDDTDAGTSSGSTPEETKSSGVSK